MTTQERSGSMVLRHSYGIDRISPVGERVADLLAELVGGLHHLENVREIDWSNPLLIEVRWRHSLSTFDFSNLTRLVFLAHDYCMRVEISPRSTRYINLLFHQRQGRTGGTWERHPTLGQAVETWRQYHEEPEHVP